MSTQLVTGSFLDVVLSPNGDAIYASSADGLVSAFNLNTGALTGQWKVGSQLGGMDVSSDGRYLLVAEKQVKDPTGDEIHYSATAVVHRLDLTTGSVNDYSTTVTFFNRGFYDVAFTADNKAILTQLAVGGGTSASTLDFATGSISSGPGGFFTTGVLSPAADHSAVLAASLNLTGAPLSLYTNGPGFSAAHDGYADQVYGSNFGIQAIAPDGGSIAQYVKTIGSAGQLNVYDGKLNYLIDLTNKYSELSGRVSGLDFSNDGGTLYVLDVNGYRVVEFSTTDWSITGTISFDAAIRVPALPLGTLGGNGAYGDRLSLTADGRHLIAFGDNGIFSIDVGAAPIKVATSGAEILYGTGLADKIDALGGDDRLIGLGGDDTLNGGAGADSILGGDGADLAVGEAGDDFIDGGAGDDTLQGGDGLDTLWGGYGGDQIRGGNGFDQINGNQGDDTAYGGEGGDWVVGGKDQDLLYGENGDDVVYGNLGNDTCYGGDGADWVRGGQGDDIIDGGAGNDWMAGDRGNDTVTGGAGADKFYFFAGAAIDRVTDFSSAAGDRVLLDVGQAYTVKYTTEGTVIDLGNGDQMILVGITQVSLGDWLFI